MDDVCAPLWDKSNKYDGLNTEVKFVRYYLSVHSFNLAQSMQDQFYNGGQVYRTPWFEPAGQQAKRLRDMKIEHCAGEFKELRVENDPDVWIPQIDEASASGVATLAALLAFFALV